MPGGAGAVSPSSPATKDVIVVHSSTPSHGSKTSPESTPSSPDSFPSSSPLHASTTAATTKATRRGLSPGLSPSPGNASTGGRATDGAAAAQQGRGGRVIQDSDGDFDDGFDDDDSDYSGDTAESLVDAVRYSQPLQGAGGPPLNSPLSFSSSTLPTIEVGGGSGAAPKTTATARTTATTATTMSSSSPYDGSSTPPLTKRRAAAVLTSPLPLRRAKQPRVSGQVYPPKHKFDMMALLRHAEQEDATEAATRRAAAALSESANQREQAARRTSGEGKKQRASDLARVPLLVDGLLDANGGVGVSESGVGKVGGGDGDGEGGGDVNGLGSFNKERLRKALDRTEVAAVSESWYFFKEYFVPSPAKRRPFPQKVAATGSRWAFLRDATMRQDYFMMGVVRKALSSATCASGTAASQQPSREPRLPDELFLWILSEACMDPLPALRAEYAAVLRCCPEQVRRFVDAERLLLLFQKLGPRWESIDLSTRLELVPTIHRPYPGRDWSSLRSLLHLVATLADCLGLETVSCAVKILLRLGIDRVVEETPDLLQDYQEAVRRLVTRVPSADWGDFCHDAGSSLYNSVQKPSLRWQVLACLPLDTPACHDLRRRLASVLLFNDPERARQDPRRQLTQGLAKLTIRDDFVLTADTNYIDLAALVNLLDAFLDDVGREAVLRSAAAAAAAAAGKHDATAAREFDAEIDDLARRLKVIGQGIEATGGGHVSRLDSKTAFERVQIRLTHSVRTRRPAKKSIFDRNGSGHGGGGELDGSSRPKQQDIRSFFLQKLTKRMER